MKKFKLTPIIITSINFVLCLMLLIFVTPNKIPLLSGIRDEIILIGSKWWMLLGIILPIIFMIFTLCLKNKFLKLLFSELIIFTSYNNMLAYSYFCTDTYFAIGTTTQIPASLSIFLPISLAIFIYGATIKNISYKNKFGINSKRTTTTEFIWKQSHITASYHFMLTGLILFIVSIIFIFIHYPLIELAIFIIFAFIPRIIVEINAKKMTLKYNDMKHKHDHLQQKKGKD